jgi:hydroxymethylglutaryl-CoA reductase (NADPH)
MTSTDLDVPFDGCRSERADSPGARHDARAAVAARWRMLGTAPRQREALADERTLAELAAFERNIENFIGTVKVPIGIAGPLRVRGTSAQGEYYLPLATTEAALVASYSRGAQLVTAAGGCTAAVLAEGVSRAPGFAFATLAQAAQFAAWVESQSDGLARAAAATTAYGRMTSVRATVEGNHVYVNLEFDTGEAAGQNMVTLAAAAVVQHIARHSPVRHRRCFLEANHSGDKKASALSLSRVRGKRVGAEARLPRALVAERLHTSPERMTEYWRMAAMGGVLSGTVGVQGHFANGLAALYIACGQDAACVAESAVGVTRLEVTDGGDLYACVTLPNVIVGAVGGGTGLPSQQACLEILRSGGLADARALAELCAALALAGELSLIGALCSGDFARAHAARARGLGLGRLEVQGD